MNRMAPDADHSAPVPAPVDEPLVDITALADYARFVARSLRRHRTGAVVTALVTLAAITGAALAWPKTYQIDGRLLVQSSSLVSSLVNPDRAVDRAGGASTMAAEEIVESRDNLVALMASTNLLAQWAENRPALLRAKDWVFALASGPQPEAHRLDAMAGLLEDRLEVGTNEEGTVGFVLKWPDPEMGRQLVEGAMKSFLEHRRVNESAIITDSIAILDKTAGTIESQITATLEQVKPQRVRTGVARPRAVRVPSVSSGPAPEATVRLARLRSALEERQQEIARLEGARTQQLAEAQARLSAALTIYTEGHPTVVALKQTVGRLTGEPPELAAALREARTLAADYDALSTNVGALTASAEQERLLSQLEASSPVASMDLFQPLSGDADPVGLRLKNQLAELAMVQARASAARAELASAQAGFKYQYTVVRPPQLPRAPIAPNVLAILGAGVVASLMLAVAFAVGVDLAGGRAIEAWQVERLVRAPIAVRMPTL